MSSIALRVLTVALGLLFIYSGHIKLTPQFFPEQHAHIRNEFGKYNKEFPFHRQTGWRPYAKNYRLTIAITELVCGTLLLLGKNFYLVEHYTEDFVVFASILGFGTTLATIVLLMVMTNAIVTFQKLNYTIEYIGTFIFISFLLVLQLVLATRSKKHKPVQKKTEKKVQ